MAAFDVGRAVMDARSVADAVGASRCCGCGACAGVCPAGAVSMRRNVAGYLLSGVDRARCVQCGRCLAACPALASARLPDGIDPFAGECRSGCLGHASDGAVRRSGQSGGVTTALLGFLLETGRIDGAVVTRFNPQTRQAEAICARTREELFSASGSCYCQSPVVNEALRNRDLRLAVVALGCQARALRLSEVAGKFKIPPVVFGLVCAGNYSGDYIDALSRRAGFDPKDVSGFRFRDKSRTGWPGEVRVEGGSRRVYLPSRERARLKQIYEAPCRLDCTDKMNVLADIVLGDPWGMRREDDSAGNNVVIVRTERGAEIVDCAEKAGAARLEPADCRLIAQGQKVDALRIRATDAGLQARRDFLQSVLEAPDAAAVAGLRRAREAELGARKREPKVSAIGKFRRICRSIKALLGRSEGAAIRLAGASGDKGAAIRLAGASGDKGAVVRSGERGAP